MSFVQKMRILFARWSVKRSPQIARFFGSEVFYINGADTLPQALTPEREEALLARLACDGEAVRQELMTVSNSLI